MPETLYRHLGPNPLWKGFGYWGFAVLLTVVAWEAGVRFPRAGLVLIGLAPFVNLYCFFRGLTAIGLALRRFFTVRAARRLGLEPEWGSASGGFLLVDGTRGLWAGNGQCGRLAELARLVCHTNGQAHYLEFWPQGAERALSRVGFGSVQELEAIASHVAMAASGAGGTPEMEFVDARK